MLREPRLFQDLGCLPDQPSTVILLPDKSENEVRPKANEAWLYKLASPGTRILVRFTKRV
ncbi:hypothetical protein C9994_04195 [Marivirga lumbricoides]|uniref:Uncharacterized protein n=1 Tax=Marivirga lumbricoides TaxID=1046115 RepID=A0A2T4DTH9_9BACT|nr:hypothetical protein C9994_04195 [Marivirga lumbricoides]